MAYVYENLTEEQRTARLAMIKRWEAEQKRRKMGVRMHSTIGELVLKRQPQMAKKLGLKKI